MECIQITHHDFDESMATQNFNKIEEIHDNPTHFETKNKILTLKHNNREVKVKVSYKYIYSPYIKFCTPK
jgi:hypothetical protein